MKHTGIVRPVDDLGRFVLPVEVRKTMEIGKKDSLEVYIEDDKIILKKYKNSCIFCDSTENLTEYKTHYICEDCLKNLIDSKK